MVRKEILKKRIETLNAIRDLMKSKAEFNDPVIMDLYNRIIRERKSAEGELTYGR